MGLDDRHPTPDLLVSFARGAVVEAETSWIEDHLATCRVCLATVANAEDDTLIELFGEAARGLPRSAGMVQAIPVVPSGFDLIELIGRGGMGVVYRARQNALGRIVALKQMRDGTQADVLDLARFRDEAQAVARLQHPNIVQVHDVGVRDGQPYIAMELLDGGSLAQRLVEGLLPPGEAARLVEILARAIQHAHDSGVIHRDLKPSNILFTTAGIPKIADFGLAKKVDAGSVRTGTGAVLGTPSYMAPEQARGEAVGPTGDVYSLGVILYECLTGRPPFRAASMLETLDQVRGAEPPPPRGLQPGVHRDLQTITLKALEKDPRRRYASALDLADDLGRYVRLEPILARPTGPAAKLAKWIRRRPDLAAPIATVMAFLVILVVGLFVHESRLRVALDKAEANAGRAREARLQVASHYGVARDTIRAILSRLDAPGVAGRPHLQELRRLELEDALHFYEAVLRGPSGIGSMDSETRVDEATTRIEFASVLTLLARNDEAERQFRLALDRLEGVRVGGSSDVGTAQIKMGVFVRLGLILADARRFEEAIDLERRALEVAETIARNDRSITKRDDVAWCRHNLASVLQGAGRSAEAEPHYREAMAIRRELLSERPGNPALKVKLAEGLINFGLICVGLGRNESAEAAYREATELLPRWSGLRLEEPTTIVARAQLEVNFAAVLMATGRNDEARSRLDEAVSSVDAFLDAEPTLAHLRGAVLMIHGTRAQALSNGGHHPESVRDWEKVISLAPEVDRRKYRIHRALALVRSGDHTAAVSEVDQLVSTQADPVSPVDFYNLACVLSLGSHAVGLDDRVAPDDRARLSADYVDRALMLIGQAASSGFFLDPANVAQARNDPDLAAIVDRPDFQNLLGQSPTIGTN